ncbi:MAG: HAMP domain-containing histidine kinase, partial [Bacteroidales bacterium]|nr:HAMP domain-containing histidine kinase [Bacteroidales bacterium]
LTANEELNVQKEELQSTLENLKRTQSQLIESEKMSALGGLVAGVAHEINTPVGIGVTAISSLIEETRRMADLYKKEEISRADFKEYLSSTNNSAKLIQKNLERTASLVQSFKQVSVDQSSEQQREFLLKAYLEDVIRSLYPKFKRRDIEINIDCNEELKLNSYPGAFAQIFTNLVLNSIAHGFKKEKMKGVIDILVKQEDKQLQIEYKDNGMGIPEEILPKIFDPFFTTDQSKGTGLGLNIVYNLVTQKLKGSIKCDSGPNKGVLFRIILPYSA